VQRRALFAGAWPYAFGALLGATLVATLLACDGDGKAFREVEEFRETAAPADLATWEDDFERRATPWRAFPDPPGEGPVQSTRWWISRQAYEMEVRRRGDRVTLGISGIDRQTFGGPWTAFGEGRITGDGGFAGAVATLSWSCIDVHHRHASDGVARIRFSADGRSLDVVYAAHETGELLE
jgi:hypothetical protein